MLAASSLAADSSTVRDAAVADRRHQRAGDRPSRGRAYARTAVRRCPSARRRRLEAQRLPPPTTRPWSSYAATTTSSPCSISSERLPSGTLDDVVAAVEAGVDRAEGDRQVGVVAGRARGRRRSAIAVTSAGGQRQRADTRARRARRPTPRSRARSAPPGSRSAWSGRPTRSVRGLSSSSCGRAPGVRRRPSTLAGRGPGAAGRRTSQPVPSLGEEQRERADLLASWRSGRARRRSSAR